MRSCVPLLFLLAFFNPGRATEKSWIIHEADLIVVGTLHPSSTLVLKLDGCQLAGKIEVEEVLFGPRTESNISYWLPGASPWLFCVSHFWRPPAFPDEFLERQLWFFRRPGNRWVPSAWYGFDSLTRRAVVEDYIRKYKRSSTK
jgi:hypothetical protein